MTNPTPSPDTPPVRATVGILVTENRRRGAEVQAERTADGLAELGWDVEFRSLVSAPEPVVGALPLTEMRRSELGRFDVPLITPTRQFLNRHLGGVVLAWGSLSVRYVAAAAATLRRRPRIGYVSIGSPMDWLSTRSGTARYRLVAGRYDFIIAVSERTRRELVEDLSIPPEKVTVITSGVPSQLLELPRREHDGPIRVLLVGSLSEEKDPMAALAAFELAAKETDLNLRVVGDGPLLVTMKDSASSMNISERVEFIGSVEDISSQLVWADLLLLTSRTEGLPGVLIEAAAAGVPAVAYDVGAVTEIVSHNSTGIVVHDRTVESAANSLVLLARDNHLRRRLGDQARTVVDDRFLIDSAVGRTDQLLRNQLI